MWRWRTVLDSWMLAAFRVPTRVKGPAILGVVALLVACGRPQAIPGATGSAVPAAGVALSVAPTPTPNYVPALTPGGLRTPPPALPTTLVTPTPAPPIPYDRPTPDPARQPSAPPPTPRPEDPYHAGVAITAAYPPDKELARGAELVVIATVKQILPGRWTTADGKRPANPHAPANRETIFNPVLVEVEQYLKGQRPERELLIRANGGTVGHDSFTYGDDMSTYSEGQRVVLFLARRPARGPQSHEGRELWSVGFRYTIGQDGWANAGSRRVPLPQLREELAAGERE